MLKHLSHVDLLNPTLMMSLQSGDPSPSLPTFPTEPACPPTDSILGIEHIGSTPTPASAKNLERSLSRSSQSRKIQVVNDVLLSKISIQEFGLDWWLELCEIISNNQPLTVDHQEDLGKQPEHQKHHARDWWEVVDRTGYLNQNQKERKKTIISFLTLLTHIQFYRSIFPDQQRLTCVRHHGRLLLEEGEKEEMKLWLNR